MLVNPINANQSRLRKDCSQCGGKRVLQIMAIPQLQSQSLVFQGRPKPNALNAQIPEIAPGDSLQSKDYSRIIQSGVVLSS